MSLSQRVRRVANSLPSGIQRADRQDVVDPLFEKLQAFPGSEGKRPAYERQVHAVLAVIRKWSAIDGIDIRIRHSASILLFVRRLQLLSHRKRRFLAERKTQKSKVRWAADER
jgi:hypothetical protein